MSEGVIRTYWKTIVSNRVSLSLLLDDLKHHTQLDSRSRLNGMGTNSELIPGCFTCILSSCYVGVIRPLKCGTRAKWGNWAAEKYGNQGSNIPLPVPNRTDILA